MEGEGEEGENWKGGNVKETIEEIQALNKRREKQREKDWRRSKRVRKGVEEWKRQEVRVVQNEYKWKVKVRMSL